MEDSAVSRPTILVVDDNSSVLALTAAILRKGNYAVLQANEGLEALRVAEDHQGTIDLLLSDIMMPGISGIELAQTLRDLRPDLNVVFMSAYTDGSLDLLSFSWKFIAKPFAASKLLETINDALRNHSEILSSQT
jgi:two-component system cell cycle sensor histidine kinase/response regulator CckA